MISFPWDNTSSTNLDRNVSSDTLAEKYFHEIAGQNSGIYAPVGSMGSVSAGTGMSVIVQPVNGIIVGRIYNEVDARTLTIQTSEALDRIDTVVIRRDKSARGVDLYIVKGTAASSPIRPALTRSGDVYEVGIADLFISANTTSITNERITDTRSESARCQIVPVVGSIDTTSMFNQFQAALDAYLDIVAAAIDETLAGNLQNQIDAIEAILDKYSLNTAPAYSASNTYALGAYVMYNNDLYRCTTAITVAEAWTAGHWTKTSVGAELNTINTNLNGVLTYTTATVTPNTSGSFALDGAMPTDVRYNSIRKIVNVFLKRSIGIGAGAWVTVATLADANMKPSVYKFTSVYSFSQALHIGVARLNPTTGVIDIYLPAGVTANSQIYFNFDY